MAIKLIEYPKLFHGLSTDRKPVLIEQGTLPVGSKFVETDTGRTFKYNGTIWENADNERIGSVISYPYFTQIVEGELPNHLPFEKLGFYSAIGTSEGDLWFGGTKYVFPVTASAMGIKSASAEDSAAGSGVRTAIIYYLDSDYNTASETITLNGTSLVTTTATNIFRLNGFKAVTCGGNGSAVGIVQLTNVTASITYIIIQAGYNRDRSSVFTVPNGKHLFITNALLSVNSATGKWTRFNFKSQYDSVIDINRDFFITNTDVILTNQAIDILFEMPIKVAGKASIKISALSEAASAYCAVTYRGWIETD